MSDNVIAQAILDEIRRLSTRFERVEGRMSALETSMEKHMSALEDRMSALEGRMSAVESRMTTLEAGMSTLEGRVTGVEGHMSIVESRICRLEARMTNIEEVVAALNLEIRTWPDMHFLGAAARLQMEHSRETRNEVSDIGVRIKEIYQAMRPIRKSKACVTRSRAFATGV